MAYDDRDYFQSKPRFEFASGLPNGTKGLMIAVVSAYVVSIIIGNVTGYTGEEYWRALAAGNTQAVNAYNFYVLVPHNVIPVRGVFDPQHWKLLTHWLFPPGIFAGVLDVLMIYFAGRLVEPLFGTKRYLALFLGACVVSGALASLVDPWIVGGDTQALVMGPTGGIFAAFMTMLWIAPNQKSFFNLKVKHIILGALALFVVVNLLIGVFGTAVAVHSPTQLLFGAGLSALYMTWLRRAGRVPSLAGGYQQAGGEPWEQADYLHGYKDEGESKAKFNKAAEKQRREEEKRIQQQRADQEKLDAILDKISRQGMTALTRAEKKFLDKQSRNNRD